MKAVEQGQGCAQAGRRLRRWGLAALVALGTSAMPASAAQASTIAIGSVLPPGSVSTEFGQVQTLFNTALPEKGVNLVSPVDGAIVRWRVQGAEGGPFYLRVLHPNGSGAYKATGTSGGVTPTSTGLQTFSANLPVKAGDLIGVDPTNAGDKIGIASEVAGAGFASIFPPPFDGAIVPPSGVEAGKEIELSAEVQPTPTVTKVSPSSDSVVGGAEVTITGTDFNAASAVKFGDTAGGRPTRSTRKPRSPRRRRSRPHRTGRRDGDDAGRNQRDHPLRRFTYFGCVVPKLGGKTLKVAKQRIRNAGCKLGKVSKVKRARAKRGKVVHQSPKPGRVLAPKAKVNLKIGR